MKDDFRGNFIKSYRYECVKVCDYGDLLEAIEHSVKLANAISGEGLVFFYISDWKDIERLPSMDVLFFDSNDEPITMEEFEYLDDAYEQLIWVHEDEEVSKFLGNNAPNNLEIIYCPDSSKVGLEFTQRVNLLKEAQSKLLPREFEFFNGKFNKE